MKKEMYHCTVCGGTNVELQFPVWVPANNIDDRENYDLDFEAQPEKDSDKCFCNDCNDARLLEKREVEVPEKAPEEKRATKHCPFNNQQCRGEGCELWSWTTDDGFCCSLKAMGEGLRILSEKGIEVNNNY